MKNRILAGVLAILWGTLGVHKFYIGKLQSGLLCVVFCWSLVPTIMGIVEGIHYLRCPNNQHFHDHYCV